MLSYLASFLYLALDLLQDSVDCAWRMYAVFLHEMSVYNRLASPLGSHKLVVFSVDCEVFPLPFKLEIRLEYFVAHNFILLVYIETIIFPYLCAVF